MQYTEIRLRGPALEYRPLPSRKLAGAKVEVKEDPILVPRYSAQRFSMAPRRSPAFSTTAGWSLPWEDDPDFYKAQCAKWTVELPTV